MFNVIVVGYHCVCTFSTLFCGHLTVKIKTFSGKEEEGQQTRGNLESSLYVPAGQASLGNESSLIPLGLMRDVVAESSSREREGYQVVIQQTSQEQIVVCGSPIIDNVGEKTEVNISCQSDVTEVESGLDNRGILPAGTIPRYLEIEPSLAIDWLEVSWDELHIKERVGAGKSSAAA